MLPTAFASYEDACGADGGGRDAGFAAIASPAMRGATVVCTCGRCSTRTAILQPSQAYSFKVWTPFCTVSTAALLWPRRWLAHGRERAIAEARLVLQRLLRHEGSPELEALINSARHLTSNLREEQEPFDRGSVHLRKRTWTRVVGDIAQILKSRASSAAVIKPRSGTAHRSTPR